MSSMRSLKRSVLAVALLASACTSGPKKLQLENPWAHPANVGGNSAVYFRLVNPGPADILVHAESAVSAEVSVHRSAQDEAGVVRMIPQPSLEIPEGGTLDFQPGGLHLMLTNLTRTLLPGDEIEITLTFEIAGPQTLVAKVLAR